MGGGGGGGNTGHGTIYMGIIISHGERFGDLRPAHLILERIACWSQL